MAFYTFNKFKLGVLVLMGLITWQLFHLFHNPPTPAPELKLSVRNFGAMDVDHHRQDAAKIDRSADIIAALNDKQGDIVELEDDKFNKHKVDKLKVRVYYEALCPDSKYFFTKQLRPVTEKLADFLNITLVPYGKASTEVVNGHYFFKCQHGEEECFANKVHACSIDIIGDMVKSVQFAECMIVDNMDGLKALTRCAKKMKVNPEPITNCSVNERGSALLKKHGDDTNILKPHFIPTITINGSKDNQAAILKNFLLQICKLIDMPLPPPCL